MKEALFAELMESVTQALDHAKGRRELRTTILPAPPAPMSAAGVRRVRKRLNASQAVFARYLNVSTKLVQAWESDRRHPDGPALILLRLGDRDPEAFTATVFGVAQAKVQSGNGSRPAKRRSAPKGRKSTAA